MDFSQSNFVKQAEELNQEKQQTELYRQKYQVDAPIEVYSMFENIVAGSENPEEEIYKLGTAYTFSENLGIEIGEAYTNLDSYSEAVYGKPIESYKGFFPNLRDSFYIGRVNRDIASLGNKIRASELAGNTDMLEDLYKELEAYENEINVRRQGTAQEGVTNAFNQVAESLPYMLDAIAVGALGNIVAPGLGTLATGLLGTDYYSGQEYLDLRKQGASVEGANKASLLSGGTQALIELALGNVAEAIGDLPGAKTLTKDLSKKVTQNLLKSPAMKKVLSNVARYGGNAVEEGLEEVLQETVSLFTEYTMSELEGYDIDQKQVANLLWENFKGGLTGSLILGGLPFGVNTAATFNDYSKIRDLAIEVESEKAFENTVKDSVVFDGMEETEKKETIKNIWDTYQSQRDEAFNQKVKEQAEITDKASGYDTELDAEYREDGRLFTEDRQLEDGKNTFVVGNPEKEGSNLYGHIDYSIDGDTITIENFKMNETREALRNEFFQEFAEQHPGMNIQWETVGKVATDIKNELIANNPYGKENGLNYYKDTQSVTDAQTRRKVADEIGKHFKFDTKQKFAAVFVLEAMANSQGRNLTEYVQNTFGENIIGDNAEIEAMANRQNQTFQGKAGATTFTKDMKAVIYAGEKADFSTWVHELSHVYQRQLSGDLLTQAEKAFNVQNGDWSTSTYTFKNSKGQSVTYSSEEAFAYGFQDWLQTGKAPNQELKNIFEQFAEFLARCYNALKNHLNLSQDVVDVYNHLLKGDNSMLALAERAVIENDKKRLADERVKQEEAKLEQENKLKEEKAEVQAQKEENLEVTDYEELEVVEETEDTQLNEDISEEEKAVFLTGTEEAKKVYETLDDTAETKEVKDNTVINTAIEQKQEIDMLFQMVGEESIKRMAESTYKRELLSNLEKAKNFYNGIYKNLDPKIRALRLKIQTGWEYDSKAGKWKYETDDSIAKFNWEGRFAEVFKLAPKNLVETLNARNITIGDMIVHEELFNIFPWLKMANVKFTNRLDTLVTSLTDEGILINLAHVKDADIKKTLGHQMQHLIQGVEHSNSGFTGNNFKKLYSTLNKAVNDTVTEEEINDIDQLSKDYFNNEGEIEARRVAERYTMISNERNSNPINFQVIGSEGAAQLDLTEEVTTRMDNLNIAMHMEDNGNTPKEIRLATGWEKGADGQWKYEIDDAYNVDFEYKSIEFRKKKPRFEELEEKLEKLNYNWDSLTQEEQEEFDKLSDEFNEGYLKNETTLKEIIDAQELFKAYPQLKDMKVTFENRPGTKRGTYRTGKIVDDFWEIENFFNDIIIYTMPNSENKEYIKTILIHEIQHAIQDIEGFGKGGNQENVREEAKKSITYSTEEKQKSNWYTYYLREESAADFTLQKRRIMKNPELIKKTGYWQAHSWLVPKKGTKEYNNYLFDRINGWIEETENAIISGTYGYRENLDFLNSYTDEELKKLRARNKYYANKYKDVYFKIWNLEKKKKELDNISSIELYKKLAGEVEARNVQERYRLFKANQQARRETLLADTQDVPSNEQIILFQTIQPKEPVKEIPIKIPGISLTQKERGLARKKDGPLDLKEKYNTEKQQRTKFYEDLINNVDFMGLLVKENKKGYTNIYYILSKTTDEYKDKFKWRVTKFNQYGPSGHTYCKNTKAIIEIMPTSSTDGFVMFKQNNNPSILFQTEGELLEEARSFDTWEEWRDYVEVFKNDFDYEQVPSNADDTFYRTTWELANREPQEPVNKDETFIDYILNRDNLKDFLAEIGSIDTSDIWQPMDEEEAREVEMLQNKKDIINTKLAQWKGFGRSVLYGNELKESTYKNLETQIKNKPRVFREIFTEIMNNQQFAVAEDEKTSTQLQKKYKLSDVEVNEIENSSPEKRRQIARELSNKDIAERVKNGTLEMGDELYDYIDTLNKEIKTLQEQYDSLEKEVAEDYQRISNWEDKELLRLHDQLLEAKEEYELKSDEVAKKIERGIRVTKKYKDASMRAKATYDTVFKKFNELVKSYEASITAKEAMTRKEKIVEIKKKLRQKQEEKRLSQELKKIRTQLIKRTMRKVKFDTVNYDQAKQIIAIQNLFEPNLLGGINKWIGTEGDTLRNVYSKWNTDNEYKEKMMRKLAGKYDVIDLLNETDTIEKYNSWTKEQRAMMYRALPKKDWIEELNLEELARERAETFHLDIGTRTISQWVEVDGKKELVTMDIPVLSEELEKLVKDALGETLYNQVVYRQFAEWTTDEMEQLAKRVNELYKEGRDELNNKALVRKQEAQEIRNAIERAVKDTGIVINDDDSEEVKQKKLKKIAKILGDDPTLKGTSAKKRTSKWQRLLEGYGEARLLSVARLLDNNKDGVNVSELYRKEDDCYNAREKKIAERTQKINKSMADNKITLQDLYSTVTIKDWYKGESATFTIDELLFMAKAAEDEQSKQAVMFGNLFSSEKMLQEKEDLERGEMLYRYEKICYNLYKKVLAEVRKLPSKYLDFADSISADYAEQYERMNKTSIEEFNQPVNRVENYVPIVRLESNGDTNENRVIDDFMAGHGLSKKGVDKGMTKSRVKIGAFHQKPIELGLYKTWADSVQRTEHFIAYAPYVRELNRVYKNQEANLTRQFIENRYGKGMLNYIDSYIAEVANPNANVQKSQLDNLVRTLRGKTAPAYLAWKTSSIIKQLITSPTPFFQFTKPIDYLKACLDCIQPSMHDAIKEKSVFMKNRKFDPIQDLIKEQEEKNTNKLEAGINKFNAIGMKGLEYVDWACVAPGWLACYRSKLAEVQKEKQKIFDAEYFKTNDKKLAQEKANQITEEIAVTYADDCVRQCQPSNRKVDIAPLFKESSEVAKAYLQFQTSLNVIWNNLRYDLPYAVKNRQFAKIVGMVSGYVVAGLGVNLMCSWFDDDDDELDKIKKSIFYATTQFTDAVPVLGSSLTKLSEKLITGESGYSMGTDLTPMVTKFMQGIQAIPKAKESGEWEDWQKVCGKFGEAIGLTLGLPVSGTKEILEVIEEQSITPLIGR